MEGEQRVRGCLLFCSFLKTMSWTDAQVHCRSNHTDLVSIRNPEENQAVATAIDELNVWIGLFKYGEHWSDGRNSSFRHWSPNFGVLLPQNCAVMTGRTSGRWGQRSCDELDNTDEIAASMLTLASSMRCAIVV
uniref:C-type lectin domain-containing protein n=1 Tax=Gadus morhua TaxID=8049 RepID=A0A8C5CQ63_GADMO